MEAYFLITNNCNLRCQHCCYDAAPGNDSISESDAKKVIDNLPSDLSTLILSGGEVFTRKGLLYSVLEYVQSKNLSNLETIEVQTNGKWARDEDIVNRTLDKLVSLGVTKVNVTSSTAFHKQAGLDLEKRRLLVDKVRGRRLGDAKPYVPIDAKIFPAGRGRLMPKKSWIKDSYGGGCQTFPHAIFIDHNAQLYPCCFLLPGSEIGDLRKIPASELIEQVKKDKTFTRLREYQYREIAERVMPVKEVERHLEYGVCNLCLELFGQGLISINQDKLFKR